MDCGIGEFFYRNENITNWNAKWQQIQYSLFRQSLPASTTGIGCCTARIDNMEETLRMLSDDAGERVKSAAGVMTRGNSVMYRSVQLMWSASGCCMKPLHQLEQTILKMELLLTVIAHCSGMRAKWNRKCINCGCKRRAQLYANAHPSSAVTVIVTVTADDDMPYLIPVSFLKPSLI